MGNPELLDALRGAELCLLIGTRMPVTARAGMEDALAAVPLASIGALPPFLPAGHAHSNDLAETLAELIGELDSGDGEPGARVIPPRPHPSGEPTLTPLPVPPSDGPGLRYREVVDTINDALPAGSDVFADAGNTGAAVVHHLRLPRHGRFTVALGMGGMGYAFGAGIGSAFARHRHPDGGQRRTYVIAGDGAFFMHGMEIHTAVEHRLPITFIILNNNAHAMCVTREQLYYGDRYGFNRFRPAYPGAGMAAMFPDLCTHAPENRAGLAAALRHCADRPGPSWVAKDSETHEIPPVKPLRKPPTREPLTTSAQPPRSG
ncbi:thiamine pyrophosphate-dependent enzyme, partial [Streptomyces sp. NPDC059083]|uniref:thiamine pyrophosphate-dependent enzyme n=1 Tax=Streptomyces sp. NPDC059083 TaxID=3346721 RepID=UPI0036A64648